MSVVTSDANYFVWEGKPLYICLIDKKGSISGEVMKQVQFRSPAAIDALKEKIKTNGAAIGSCFTTGLESCPYLFIVVRNSYQSKYDEKTVKTILDTVLPQLIEKGYHQLRFCTRDYPSWSKELFLSYNFDNAVTVVSDHCGWKEK